MACHVVIPVADVSQVGEARRTAARLAGVAGLNETDAGRVAIVATELATNLVRPARGVRGTGGEILIAAHRRPGEDAVELLAIDAGPGIADLGRCLQDGFSTGGTAGNGLGAIRRLSDRFDVFSAP